MVLHNPSIHPANNSNHQRNSPQLPQLTSPPLISPHLTSNPTQPPFKTQTPFKTQLHRPAVCGCFKDIKYNIESTSDLHHPTALFLSSSSPLLLVPYIVPLFRYPKFKSTQRLSLTLPFLSTYSAFDVREKGHTPEQQPLDRVRSGAFAVGASGWE